MDKDKLRERVIGLFLGVAIGDALGMPLEFLPEDRKQALSRIEQYIRPDGHKWFDGRDAGTWTDDWYYTKLVIESLLACNGINLDDLARRHAESFISGEYQIGAGGTTRAALKHLAEGKHWSESGVIGGAGNGIAMKVAPFGVLHFLNVNAVEISALGKVRPDPERSEKIKAFYQDLMNFALMTHATKMAAASAVTHANAIAACLFGFDPFLFEEFFFWHTLLTGCIMAENSSYADTIEDDQDKLSARFLKLQSGIYKNMGIADLAKKLAPDKGYVYYTLPFCYGAFMRNPQSINTLYDVVNAGGDTDTNGSIVGSLLGAYNGYKIFPKHLVEGLYKSDEVIDLAERFYRQFFAS